ncbi:hypothetical protein RND81_09G010000 [Saponaria officinalis]|uniref:Secreted protein n=1 Tax=Saponaria officinalis TaxID=3572 RepID=A0AAW1IH19_SAPOF
MKLQRLIIITVVLVIALFCTVTIVPKVLATNIQENNNVAKVSNDDDQITSPASSNDHHEIPLHKYVPPGDKA